jgi:hypothetical protein
MLISIGHTHEKNNNLKYFFRNATTVTDGKVMLKYTYPTSGYDFKPLLTWSFPFPPILGLKGGGKSPIRRYAEIRK